MSQNEPVMSQRERFEAFAKQNGYNTARFDRYRYADNETKAAWAVWQAACPEGWQAVPVDPTAGMMKALWLDDSLGRHSAMLAAAPKPEDVCKSPD